jgi:hypothetical protein
VDTELGQPWLHESNFYQIAETACAASAARGWSCLRRGIETDRKLFLGRGVRTWHPGLKGREFSPPLQLSYDEGAV